MDQKIAKIFTYFADIKHENLFSLCVLQLVEAYEDSPQALKPILYNLKSLFFSTAKESRLKLKQRQLAASIIEKIIAKHTAYLDNFLGGDNVQEMENFHIEEGGVQHTESQLDTYPQLAWDEIPFEEIIQKRPLLLASDKRFKETEEELRRIEAEFFDKLNDAKTATATNIKIFMGDLTDLQQGETKAEDEGNNRPSKYEKKIEKLKKKAEESLIAKMNTISVFNPFNFIYEFGIENVMSPNWQTRHLSVLLLKAVTPWLKYIGFSFTFQMKNFSKEEAFSVLYETCKKQLKHFLDQNKQPAKHQLIFHSILVLSLDRFADYQAERSNIMVRSVAAKILTIVYQTIPHTEKHQILIAVKKLLQHEPSQDDPLAPFAWELRHSFVYWLHLVIEQPRNRQETFKMFSQTFILLLTRIDEEQVILTLCQCLSLFSAQPFFTVDYARDVNNMLWDIIENLDDVSYSATKIFALLAGYLHLIQIDELDCLLRLKQFFTNRTEQVRREFYNLEREIFARRFKISTKQNYRILDRPPTKENIIPWTAIQFLQEIMVEEYSENLNSLAHLGAALFPYLLEDSQESMISQFCANVVCVYEPIQTVIRTQFMNKENYRFICHQERVDLLNDHVNIRIWKVSQIIGEMLVEKENYLTEGVLEPFISLGTYVDTRFLLITLGIISSAFRKSSSVASNCRFLLEFAQNVLKLQSHEMTTGVIEIYESQFQAKLQEYILCVTEADQLQICNFNIGSKSWQNRSKLHTKLLGKYSTSPSADLHILISSMETIVQIQKDLVKHLKILASYIYCCLLPEQQPKPLNLIIKSLQENLKQQRYYFISTIATACISKLSRILMTKNRSVFVKFNTNTLNQIASKYELKVTNIERAKGQFQIDSTRMQGIGGYIEEIGRVDPNWLNEFEGCFLKGFEQQEHLKACLNLLEGTIHHVVSICNKQFLQKLLKHLGNQLKKNSKDSEDQLYSIIKRMLTTYAWDWKDESNTFLQWFYTQMSISLPIIKILQKTLEESLAKLSPVCCVFLLQTIRLMTGGGELREPAMSCLSNLMMGAFISTSKPNFSSMLEEIAEKGLSFVRDFKNINNFEYKLEIKQKLELRYYQQQGIKWLGFLVKYYLNGALCDDMGLGKTLQTLTVIENQYSKTNKKGEVSLIVVPSTLIEHWRYEYKKYFSDGCLNPCCVFRKDDTNLIAFSQNKLKHNLIITSYTVVQKAVGIFQKFKYKFIILDEGHLVKNPKTNKFKALARLQAAHKFILSGTPIQNKLLELWGIFEFLMPGYLGTEEAFKVKYNKLFNVNLMTFKQDDLLFSKQQKEALEALHIKVMPFILRRLKKEVLKQLPDKIIQDYLCRMVPIQQQLYSQFHRQLSKDKFDVEDYSKEESSALSVLNQMRKIVNHPNLVGKKLGYDASGKFLALKDLFDDMGFESPSSVTNKIIIFSRFNATLDLIQSLLLTELYPEIKYSKLTGNIPQNKRFDIAQQFNDSFDIKVLLTTTSIGGYGLNLTSANIVIMFDHDYNPSVDMQAIDRAHRLGQKNVLNVYRLIMKDTLEEKIMGIQRFKSNLASAIVNLDNASIKNIEDSKLPDLLQKISVIQETEKKKVNKSLYATMIQEMEKDAIEVEDYEVQY